MDNLGERINQILVENNINGAKFADITGIGKSGVYKILRGETKKLKPETVDVIIQKFPKYTKEWLLGAQKDTSKSSLYDYSPKEIITYIYDNIEVFKKETAYKILMDNELKDRKIEELELKKAQLIEERNKSKAK